MGCTEPFFSLGAALFHSYKADAVYPVHRDFIRPPAETAYANLL